MIDIKYKKLYDKFIEHYRNTHVNPWHEISELELQELYDYLVNSMEIDNKTSFTYFMGYIIKRLSGSEDAHTMYCPLSIIPMNFRMFNNDILVNYPDDIKFGKVISINGITMDLIIKELEEIITYGTKGKRRYEIEKALFNRHMLFGLPSLRNSNELVFEIAMKDGERLFKKFEKQGIYSSDEMFDYDEYRYGKNATYRFIDNCLVYNHSSVQLKFKEEIEKAIDQLKKEDLSNIDTIIVDIRGNIGGNSSLNKILMDFLEENKDKKLICLTDYRVFSAGRYALRDLINLGAITIGEEIGTPINCYGNNSWIDIDGHYFSASKCYFHSILGWSASSKEEFNNEVTDELLRPYIFKPDILIEETEDDYKQSIDPILDYAIEYSCTKVQKNYNR